MITGFLNKIQGGELNEFRDAKATKLCEEIRSTIEKYGLKWDTANFEAAGKKTLVQVPVHA